MAALPWVQRQEIRATDEYVAMASRLPLNHYRSVPAFLRDTMRIRSQLAATDGLVGYALNAHIGRKSFLTFSVWVDQASLDSFARTNPHQSITERLHPIMGESRFVFFPIIGADVPLRWSEVEKRLGPKDTSVAS